MKLYYDKNSKDPTYFIQMGYRNGKKVTTKNIRRIGKHSELLKITDDPLAYANEEVRKANEEQKEAKPVPFTLNINFDESVQATDDHKSTFSALNIGYFYLQYVYQQLKLAEYFKNTDKTQIYAFDFNEINRFMTFSRILHIDSKRSIQMNPEQYYENPVIEYQHILWYLDVMAEHYDDYLEHLFKHSSKIVRADTQLCYYNCSNFCFGTKEEDEDYVDPITNESIIDLRKYGFNRKHIPTPVVQMGIFINSDGIPVSMTLSHSSDSEQSMAVSCVQKTVKRLNEKSFICCADANLGADSIRLYNSMGGRSFIVIQSIMQLSANLKDNVFTDEGYRRISDNIKVSVEYLKTFDKTNPDLLSDYQERAYKVIPADTMEALGLMEWKSKKRIKAKGVMSQYLIITFSRKYKEYQKYVRNKRIESAKKIIEQQNAESYKNGSDDILHYIKLKAKNEDGKEVMTTYEFNEDAVNEEEKYDGFCAIAVNLEVLDDNGDPIHEEIIRILDIIHQRYLIEMFFSTTKTYFKTKPVYMPTSDHIKAHFMICCTALLIFRLLQEKVNDYDENQNFTEEDIIDTLNSMVVANIDDCYYRALYKSSDTLHALEHYAQAGLQKKNYRPKVLNTIIRNMK